MGQPFSRFSRAPERGPVAYPIGSTLFAAETRLIMKRQSLIHYFYEKEANQPDQPYLHQPFGDRWETYTWGEVGQTARRMANYLLQQGLQPGSKVGLVSANCREWVIADLAIMMAKCVSVPFFLPFPVNNWPK